MGPLLTPAEVGRLLKITTRAVRSLARRGVLHPVRLTRKIVRFREDELRTLIVKSGSVERPNKSGEFTCGR